jgi:hypothetical protein
MSIARFCVRNDISEPYFFKLKANGLGPNTMRLGARTLITAEAERRWRQARERKPVSVEAIDKVRREARKDAATAAIPVKEEPGDPITESEAGLRVSAHCQANGERDA